MKPESSKARAFAPLLFHGTTAHRARRIVAGGFRRGRAASYTGTAVNLTESVSLAWEYGPQRSGKILAVTLDPATRWQNADTLPPGESYDGHFADGQTDALRTYGGNVWLLWNTERAQVRVLSLPEIMTHIVDEFREDGPDHGYNGDVAHLASLYWIGEATTYAELRICAPASFDVEAWKQRTLARGRTLLALAGAKPGDGAKGQS
jgi:hypothetical protein